MRRRWSVAAAVLALGLPAAAWADLGKALAESNLEKRSQLALENARQAYKAARAAYDKGDNERAAAAIREIGESVDLAFTSLNQTGKDPRRSPKYFKKAEIETRELLKRLDAFEHNMSFNDRPMLQDLKPKVQKAHDDLLEGLMEGKRK